MELARSKTLIRTESHTESKGVRNGAVDDLIDIQAGILVELGKHAGNLISAQLNGLVAAGGWDCGGSNADGEQSGNDGLGLHVDD